MGDFVKKHRAEDIERQFINNDIVLWKEEVSSISVEIAFFMKLLRKKTELSSEDDIFSKILKKLESKEKENKKIYTNLINYIRKTGGLNECEDLDCETYYINDHIDFKLDVESFLYKYKKLKRITYLKLMDTID